MSATAPVRPDFEDSTPRTSSSEPRRDPIVFQRLDWTLYRDLGTLAQKAGVSRFELAELALKELADNALDAGTTVSWGTLDSGFYVEDDGPGIPGDDATVADLFSVTRPMTSTKLLRLPTRGALGNGLRVVAGLVLATSGRLVIRTRGRAIEVKPRFHDGGNDVQRLDEVVDAEGTRVELYLGPGAEDIEEPTGTWLAEVPTAEPYRGRSSAYWYDSDSWFALVNAAGETPVRALLAELEGLSGAKAGRLSAGFLRRSCGSLRAEEAEALLLLAREATRPVVAKRLGLAWGEGQAYARRFGEFGVYPVRGSVAGIVPFVVEARVEPAGEEGSTVLLTVNRTRLPGDVYLRRSYGSEKVGTLAGCGLREAIETGKKRTWLVEVNVLTPFYSKTSDGKHPDLAPFGPVVREALDAAIGKGRRLWPATREDREVEELPEVTSSTIEQDVVALLDGAIAKASGNGANRYNVRQLFYVIRPALGPRAEELTWGYFTQLIGREEQRRGHDLPGIIRDARGSVYHPHTGETVPLGTLNVESYSRPAWTFNKVLFIEKEGFFEVLKADGWPERHDCALVTSKGQATRAAKDLLDLLGDSGEPVTVYALHDADAAGTVIVEALVEATLARPRRRVEVVNLGLEPSEAIEMGLDVEDVEEKSRRRPVASYVPEEWAEWLQRRRVELNAMTSPEFIEWLDGKFAETEKLVPPAEVAERTLRDEVEELVRAAVLDELKKKFDVEGLVRERLESIEPRVVEVALDASIRSGLDADPYRLWSDVVADVARDLTEGGGR